MTSAVEMLEEILRTDALGAVELGADRASILEALGEPDQVGQGDEGVEFIAYVARRLQVAFEAGEVVHFGVYRQEVSAVAGDADGGLSWEVTPEQLGQWLDDAEIPWEGVELEAEGEVHVEVGAAVAVFVGERFESLQVS